MFFYSLCNNTFVPIVHFHFSSYYYYCSVYIVLLLLQCVHCAISLFLLLFIIHLFPFISNSMVTVPPGKGTKCIVVRKRVIGWAKRTRAHQLCYTRKSLAVLISPPLLRGGGEEYLQSENPLSKSG